MARQVWVCVVIWHHPLVPCHIPAHRLTSSRMVMEKSVKRKENYSAPPFRTTDMRMRVTSHVIVLVLRRGGRLTRFKYLKLYLTSLTTGVIDHLIFIYVWNHEMILRSRPQSCHVASALRQNRGRYNFLPVTVFWLVFSKP